MIGAHGRNCLQLSLTLVLLAGFAGSSAFAANTVRTVFVPRAVIYPGDVITAEAIVERKIAWDDTSPAIFGENPADLVGKVARRTLMRGELVPSSSVRQQDTVTQGHPYKMVYNSEFVSIVGIGVPLQSGAAGETISVRNPDTGLVIKARIEPDQTLTVDEE